MHEMHMFAGFNHVVDCMISRGVVGGVVERSKVFNFFDRCALDPEAGVRYRVAPFRSLFPPLRTQK